MPRPRAGIETYKNERLLWQSVLQHHHIKMHCPTRTKTLQLIQRLHAFRVLHRAKSFSGDYSIFDDYIIRNPDKGTTIIIERRSSLDEIQIETPVDLKRAQYEIESLDNAQPTNIDNEIQQLERKYEQTRKLKIDPDKPLDL
jgi:hypothetical protein